MKEEKKEIKLSDLVLLERFLQRVKMPEGKGGCWVWKGHIGNFGYGKLGNLTAHRISYEFFIGPIPKGMFVLHHCDNPPCVNPMHLFIGTQGDNMKDMVRKGRSLCGDRNPSRRMPERLARGRRNKSTKLTPEEVRAIRKMFKTGMTQTAIGKVIGINRRTVCDVVHRRNWKYLED